MSSSPEHIDDVEALRADVDRLSAEVERLRALVGPDEASYGQLQVDLLGARDAVIGAEHEIGMVRGRNQALETEVVRLRRDFDWFRGNVIDRAKRVRGAASRASSSVAGRSGRR